MSGERERKDGQTSVVAAQPTSCYSIDVADDGTAWCTDTNGDAFSFDPDSGWIAQASPTNNGNDSAPFTIAVGSADAIYAVGAGGVLQSFTPGQNGGTWSPVSGAPGGSFKCVGAASDGTVWIDLGNGTGYLLISGGTWSSYTYPYNPAYPIRQYGVSSIGLALLLDTNGEASTYNAGNWSTSLPTSLPSLKPATSMSMGSDAFAAATDGTNLYVGYGDSTQSTWIDTGDDTGYGMVAVGSKGYIWALDGSGNPVLIAGDYGSGGPDQKVPFEARGLRPKHGFLWDTESPFDVSQSTHLWIVYQSAILASQATGNYATPGQWIYNQLEQPSVTAPAPDPSKLSDFHRGMCQGLYDADFLPAYNNPVAGVPTYASHFYDPQTGTNWRGQTSPTALSNGTAFWAIALSEYGHVMYQSGYNLGLAMHYLTDLTQPMHASNYTYISSKPFGFHTDFETYALASQTPISPPGFTSPLLDQQASVADYYISAATKAQTFESGVMSAYDDWQWWKVNPWGKDGAWHADLDPYMPSILQAAITVTSQALIAWATSASASSSA